MGSKQILQGPIVSVSPTPSSPCVPVLLIPTSPCSSGAPDAAPSVIMKLKGTVVYELIHVYWIDLAKESRSFFTRHSQSRGRQSTPHVCGDSVSIPPPVWNARLSKRPEFAPCSKGGLGWRPRPRVCSSSRSSSHSSTQSGREGSKSKSRRP
jgi:hypothetical protein